MPDDAPASVTILTFFTVENRHHHGVPLHEWLLTTARQLGLPGGTAFRAVAGFGESGELLDDAFFELAGDAPVMVQFFAEAGLAQKLLYRIEADGLSLHYLLQEASAGQTDGRG